MFRIDILRKSFHLFKIKCKWIFIEKLNDNILLTYHCAIYILRVLCFKRSYDELSHWKSLLVQEFTDYQRIFRCCVITRWAAEIITVSRSYTFCKKKFQYITRNAYQHWSRLNMLKIRAIYCQKLTKEAVLSSNNFQTNQMKQFCTIGELMMTSGVQNWNYLKLKPSGVKNWNFLK